MEDAGLIKRRITLVADDASAEIQVAVYVDGDVLLHQGNAMVYLSYAQFSALFNKVYREGRG